MIPLRDANNMARMPPAGAQIYAPPHPQFATGHYATPVVFATGVGRRTNMVAPVPQPLPGMVFPGARPPPYHAMMRAADGANMHGSGYVYRACIAN